MLLAVALGFRECERRRIGRSARITVDDEAILELDQLAHLLEKPRVDAGEFVDFLDGHAHAHGVSDVVRASLAGPNQLVLEHVGGDGPLAGVLLLGIGRSFGGAASADARILGGAAIIPPLPGQPLVVGVKPEAEPLHLHRADALLKRLLERPPDGHRLADGLHLRGQRLVRVGELLERPARDLHHDVVDGRLEAGRRGAGDVVGQLVQCVPHRQFRGDSGDGVARRLARQGTGTRHPRVHLDHHLTPGLGVHPELDVAPAGVHADRADDRDGAVAHLLIFLVGQRLNGGNGDRVAGVDAHRVEVFDRADDDHVVGAVAHQLQLELLPAVEALLDQNLAHPRGRQPPRHDGLELFHRPAKSPALAAQCVGRANAAGEAHILQHKQRLLPRLGDARASHVHADLEHGALERRPFLGLVNRLRRRPDHLDAMPLENPLLRRVHRAVQPGLPPQGGQHRLDRVPLLAFADEDFFDELRRDRLDVGPVRRLRVGHDRRRVRVDQHHAVALLAKGLARLGAGIVELATLPDDDRARADDEDVRDVCSFGHCGGILAAPGGFRTFPSPPPRAAGFSLRDPRPQSVARNKTNHQGACLDQRRWVARCDGEAPTDAVPFSSAGLRIDGPACFSRTGEWDHDDMPRSQHASFGWSSTRGRKR